MTQFMIAVSRFVFTGLIAFYTLFHFWGLKKGAESMQKGIAALQTILMFVFHLGAYIVLYYTTNNIELLLFYGFQVLVFMAVLVFTKLLYPDINRFLVNDMVFLLMIGMVILSRINMSRSIKQFIIATVSIVIGLFVPVILKKFKFLAGISGFYAVFGIGLLGIVWLFGAVTNGSKISYTVGDITFQPSELVKLVYVFCLAALLQKEMKAKRIISVSLIACLHVIILILSRDLGSGIIFFVVFICMLFASTRKVSFLVLGVASSLGAGFVVSKVFSHVQNRFIAWTDPWSTIDKEGYHIAQSLFAICSGKWFGMGLNQGSPTSIPYVSADSIFSAIAQELGVIFGICLILVYLATFLMVLKVVKNIRNRFYRLTGIGLGVTMLFQVFLTIGGGSKFIPLTGVTLPLISYGGTSVLTTIILFFILFGISEIGAEEERNGITYGFEGEIAEETPVEMKDVLLKGKDRMQFLFRYDEFGFAYDEWGNIFDKEGYPCDIEGNRYSRKERPDLYAKASTKLFLAYKANEANAREQKRQEQMIEQAKFQNVDVSVLSFAFSILFVVLCGYIGNYVRNNEANLISNSYNPVQAIYMKQNYRGSIYDRNGEVIAYTDVKADGSEERVYPYNELFSHVVGYSTKGRSGVEDMANSYLIQCNASLSTKMNAEKANRKNPGDDVTTTLDVDIQEAAQKAMGLYDGAVILTDVKSGEILCMYSNPGFDPNQIDTEWDRLTKDKTSTVLLNRVAQGLYPPGSTFKICTALEYYKEHDGNISSYHFDCNGKYQDAEGDVIHCYHGSKHGAVDFKKSFAKSCNSSFANMGLSLDRGEFSKTLEKLGFGKQLPCDFPYSQSSVKMGENVNDYDCMQTCIGQGTTLVTPLHMNMITCAIANDGVLMKPYIISHVNSADDEVVKAYGAEKFGSIISEEDARFMQDIMKSVVEEGTATKLSGSSYTAAGKTGSAEYNSNHDSHAWFTGFAPADNPQVAVTIIVEGAGSGGDFAVPIAKRVFDAYFEE